MTAPRFTIQPLSALFRWLDRRIDARIEAARRDRISARLSAGDFVSAHRPAIRRRPEDNLGGTAQ